jgi:amidase
LRIYEADGGEDFHTSTAPTGEPVIKTMVPQADEHIVWPKPGGNIPVIPHWKSLEAKQLKAYELWQLHKQRRELQREYLEYWQASASKTGTGRPIDAIIAPVAPYAAPPHGMNT